MCHSCMSGATSCAASLRRVIVPEGLDGVGGQPACSEIQEPGAGCVTEQQPLGDSQHALLFIIDHVGAPYIGIKMRLPARLAGSKRELVARDLHGQ